MPHIEKHAPGSFCWLELATTDQKAAKGFYSGLFGWKPNDMSMGPNEFYTIFQLEGRDTGAAYTLRRDQQARGVQPRWNLYVGVESADETAQRVAQAGGKVLAQPFDVFDVGRMAPVQDPAGAPFAIWQPKRHTGTGIAGVDGTLCWADLMTPDAAAAARFYSDVFGWKIAPGEKDSSGYLHIQNREEFIGGIPPARDGANTPPHWLLYFLVSDCDAAAAQAQQLGATLDMQPMTMEGVGRWAEVADPQGAVFAVFQPIRR